MATYGGFAPGSYNAWALNLITNIFCSPGVARGMQVTAPGGMSVTLGTDAVALDGVVVAPNGGWVRIDQAITYTVPANGGTGTRTDAIVAFLDPTGVANPTFSITYNSNWSGGFGGNTSNQWVIALVSVAVGAVSIAPSNITMNPNTAHFGNPAQVVASDGVALQVVDSSTLGQMYLQPVLSTPSYRALVLQAVDSAGVSHNFVFDQLGNATLPNAVALSVNTVSRLILNNTAVNFETPGSITSYVAPGGISSQADWLLANPTGGWVRWPMKNGTAWVDANGHLWDSTVGGNPVTTSGNTVGVRIFTGTTQPTNATNGDIWINA